MEEPSINSNTSPPSFGAWYGSQSPPRKKIILIIVLCVIAFFFSIILILALTLTPKRWNNEDVNALPTLYMLGFRGSQDLEFLEFYNGTMVKNQTTGYYANLWDPFGCAFTGPSEDRKDKSQDFYCFSFDSSHSIQKLVRINNGKLLTEQVIPLAGNGYVENAIYDHKREELITLDQAWFVRIIVYDKQGTLLRRMLLMIDSWWRLAKIALDEDRNILYFSPWYYTHRGGFKQIRGTNYVTGESVIEAEVQLPPDGSILDFVVKSSHDTEYDHLIVLATENIFDYSKGFHLILIDFDPRTNDTKILGAFPSEIGISPDIWVHTVYNQMRRSYYAVMWNNTKTSDSDKGEAVLVCFNTDTEFVTYIPLPGVILPEEGDPYYSYNYYEDYDMSTISGSGSDDGEKNDKDVDGKDGESTENRRRRRTVRSIQDLNTIRRTKDSYWPAFYYSMEAIAIV